MPRVSSLNFVHFSTLKDLYKNYFVWSKRSEIVIANWRISYNYSTNAWPSSIFQGERLSLLLEQWKKKKKRRDHRGEVKVNEENVLTQFFLFFFLFFLAGKKLARKKGTLRWHQRVTRRQLWRPFRKISKIAREVKLYCVLRHDCNFITPLRKCIILKVNIHINYILYVIN